MSHDKLTPKQEKFCQAYIETGNATEAYRQAYNAENAKDSTINRKAAEMFENGKITARLKELNEYHQKRHGINVDTLTDKYMGIYEKHCDTNPSAAVSALNSVAKLHGLGDINVNHKGKFEHNITKIEFGDLKK